MVKVVVAEMAITLVAVAEMTMTRQEEEDLIWRRKKKKMMMRNQ
jgi:hypothetical protein